MRAKLRRAGLVVLWTLFVWWTARRKNARVNEQCSAGKARRGQ